MLVLLASVFFSGFAVPLDQLVPLRTPPARRVTHGIQLPQDFMLRADQSGLGTLVPRPHRIVLTSVTVRRNLRSAN
jgi:hypothetical protein